MTEREIIIEGLERRQRFKTPDGSSCVIPANLLQDALALLKAQEPRVMTPEEVIGNIILGRDRVIWFEFRDSIVPMNTKSLAYNDYLVDDDMPILNDTNIEWRDSDGKKDGVIVAEYNDVFRCWTSRPDEKVRTDTPWADN